MTTIKKIKIPITGEVVTIEEFVRRINEKFGSNYYVISREDQERQDLVPAMIQQLHKRITGVEDYLNDWTESQLKTNKVVTDQFAILSHKVTELDTWANSLIDETNRIIKEINAHDPEGTRKYIFGVLDNIVQEINEQRKLLEGVSSGTDKDLKRKRYAEPTPANQQKESDPTLQKKRGRGRPKKTDKR